MAEKPWPHKQSTVTHSSTVTELAKKLVDV